MPEPPVHVHPSAEESFEGTLDVFVDGDWSQVRAGEKATVPPGVPHTLRNTAEEPVKTVTRIQRGLQGAGPQLGGRFDSSSDIC